MTKEKMEEKIISLLGYCSEDLINSINDIFEEFTRTNVCIPKGENRHPYADVLHEWIEGAEIEWHSVDLDKNKVTRGVWYSEEGGISIRRPFSEYVQYRIKPSDLVYEWQYHSEIHGTELFTNFMTNDEFKNSTLLHTYWIKIEETKRVRS
jgi:hypothetical protein